MQDLESEARKVAEEIRRGPYSGCHLSFSDEAALESILLAYAQRVREPLEKEIARLRHEMVQRAISQEKQRFKHVRVWNIERDDSWCEYCHVQWPCVESNR